MAMRLPYLYLVEVPTPQNRCDDLERALAELIAITSERALVSALNAIACGYPDFPLTVRLAKVALMHKTSRAHMPR
jgi:hypothetical protein